MKRNRIQGRCKIAKAPIISSVAIDPASAASGTQRTITINATDPQGQTLDYTCLVNGVAATATGQAHVFNSTPSITSPVTASAQNTYGITTYETSIQVVAPSGGGLKAFPTAEGFGRNSTGGRGGAVLFVTNLNDSGAGSLRAAMMATGARTIIPRVAGTISLLTQIRPTAGFMTIAGQAAPGGGICVKNDPSNLTGSPIFLNAPHNIIRHIRIRPGPTSGTVQDTTDGITIDALATDTILDHCSISWATDEPINSTKNSKRLTIQNCLVYEGLSQSTHGGEHSKGIFAEGDDITLYKNLIAHGMDRMPNAGVGLRIDVVNNLVYNWGTAAGQYFSMYRKQSDPTSGLHRNVNLIGNRYIAGPNSTAGVKGADYWLDFSTFPNEISFYLSGNLGGGRNSLSEDERNFLATEDWGFVTAGPIGGTADLPPILSAADTETQVKANSGAFPRDASDTRVVNHVTNLNGSIINDPFAVGGWPTLAAGTAYTDANGDGMEDAWATARGVTGDPNGDDDADGYTNLEEFLNSLVGE